MKFARALAAPVAALALLATTTAPVAAEEATYRHTVKDRAGDTPYALHANKRLAGADVLAFTYKKVRQRLVAVMSVKDLNRATARGRFDYLAVFETEDGRLAVISARPDIKGAYVSIQGSPDSALVEHRCGRRVFNKRTEKVRINVPLRCFTLPQWDPATETMTEFGPEKVRGSGQISLTGMYAGDPVDDTRVGKFIDLI